MFKKLLFPVFLLLAGTCSFSAQQKTDVWDFGAQQLDPAGFNNELTEAKINSWYTAAAGSSNVVMPASFVASDLSWTGGANDRLRTSNTNLTRYDSNVGPGAALGYTGRLYVNAGSATGRFLTLALQEDDEVSVFVNSDAAGMLNFVYAADPAVQTNQSATTTAVQEFKFVAKKTGSYRIFDSGSKPSYYRIQRTTATYVNVSGIIDTSATSVVPQNYSVIFTNSAGKTWTAPVENSAYTVTLPANYTYQVSLGNANGYVISEGETFEATATSTVHNISVAQVELYQVTGSISGLSGTSSLNNLNLSFMPDPNSGTIYTPKAVVNKTTGTYSVNLEANLSYTISATGVNDDEIADNILAIPPQNTVHNIVFSAKPKYGVSISAPTLNAVQLSQLQVKFTNVSEPGYVYSFTDLSAISLRNGTYSVAVSGLDAYPVQLQLTSYLKVNNAPTTKILTFVPVSVWSFEDKVITAATPYYKGLAFTGNIVNEIAKGHLVCQAGSTISVPVNPSEKLTITYYYAANFSIDGNAPVTTSSASTSLLEKTEYIYNGNSAGNVMISVGGLTYITDISKNPVAAYSPTVTVGPGKDFQTVTEALTAIGNMQRTPDKRVTVLIDPGNYEEMIVIRNPNITLKNASPSPSISLANQGVDISPNAVRITSYYGVGYNYFSQGPDNKWSALALEVNKANGFTDYTNLSGTSNGSYWNATAVIAADNFVAEDIIFENSFNQYISAKEAADVLVEVVGTKGTRPKTAGDVAVQNRSFVERAAALAVANGADKVFLKNCRIVGRQDTFFGGTGARVAVYKGVMMGAVDYIFGPMTAVFYQSKFAMNTSDASSDAAYLLAPQQLNGRGFLLYECTVGSANPGSETASVYRAKPGYFGRPWAADTSEAVIYKATVETSDYPGSAGLSLISPPGWTNSLGGTSDRIYEYATNELSGVSNAANRVPWSKVLQTPFLTDGTEITLYNFTKGNDGWNPFLDLPLAVNSPQPQSTVQAFSVGKSVYISKVNSLTSVKVFSMNGSLLKSLRVHSDTQFSLNSGVYIVTLQAKDGGKSVKILIP
ncbi:pectinesterase family protein [Kaistella palustris]|uniref:pectinesterase family protein n=1 Tax=Kaistella palustris TaxID=493376 RepID=UPI00040E42BF|nr:pectinesterase family protein [Kaistella palustris]